MHVDASMETDLPAPVDWDAYAPTPETRELAETARAHFARLVTGDDLRALIDGRPAPNVWSAIAEHGYVEIGIPERLGGVGTLVDLCAVLEEGGRALLPGPLLPTALATQTLLTAGLLDAPAPTPLALAAAGRGDRLIALGGALASTFVTVDADGSGALVRTIRREAHEVHAVRDPVDPTRASVWMPRAGGTEIASSRLDVDVDAALAAARTCIAADLIGTAAGALDASITHALTREQFGRPIGTFQAVKHLLANAYVRVERARSLLAGAAVESDRDRTSAQARRLSLLAKAAAGDAALQATALRTQLLGAMGLTFESDSPLAIRRARETAPFLGTTGALYAQVAAETMERAA